MNQKYISIALTLALIVNILAVVSYMGSSEVTETPEGIIVELVSAPQDIGPDSTGIYVYNVTNMGPERTLEVSLSNLTDDLDADIIPDEFTLKSNATRSVYIYIYTSEDSVIGSLELDVKVEDVNNRASSATATLGVAIKERLDYALIMDSDYFEPGYTDDIPISDQEYLTGYLDRAGGYIGDDEGYTIGSIDSFQRVYTQNTHITVTDPSVEGGQDASTFSFSMKVVNYGNVPISFYASYFDMPGLNSQTDSVVNWPAYKVVMDNNQGIIVADQVDDVHNEVGDEPDTYEPDVTGDDGSDLGDGLGWDDTINPYIDTVGDAYKEALGGELSLGESTNLLNMGSSNLFNVMPMSSSYVTSSVLNRGVVETSTYDMDFFQTKDDRPVRDFLDNYDDEDQYLDSVAPGQTVFVTIVIDLYTEQYGSLYDYMGDRTVLPVGFGVARTDIGLDRDARGTLVNFVLEKSIIDEIDSDGDGDPDVDGDILVDLMYDLEMTPVTGGEITLENPGDTATFNVALRFKGRDMDGDGKVGFHLNAKGRYLSDIDGNIENIEIDRTGANRAVITNEYMTDSDKPITGTYDTDGEFVPYAGWNVRLETTDVYFTPSGVGGVAGGIDSTITFKVFVDAPQSAEGGEKFVFDLLAVPKGRVQTALESVGEGGLIADGLFYDIFEPLDFTRGPLGLTDAIFGSESYSSVAAATDDGFGLDRSVEDVKDTLTTTVFTIIIIAVIAIIVVIVVGIVMFARASKRTANLK